MDHEYFSDREQGPRERTRHEITKRAWGGIVAEVESLVNRGAFGDRFPDECPDGRGLTGTDVRSFSLALQANIPGIQWPLDPNSVPSTLSALDLVEFCYERVAEPMEVSYHSFFGHHHLEFDVEAGRKQFRERVNRIFARNGLAFEIGEHGRVERIAPPVLHEVLASAAFDTGDAELDRMLETARERFLDPDPAVRRESLEKLWDAWERLKTLEPGKDKKESATSLLEKASPEPTFRQAGDDEARTLTSIGNKFQIRHSETSQVPLESGALVDYLFHRLFAMIQLLLASRESGVASS